MVRRQSKLSLEECKQTALMFFQKQKKFKKVQTQFGEIKTNFYNDMEDYFSCNNIDGNLTIECNSVANYDEDCKAIVIKRVQSSKVEFIPDKLEKALGKDLSQDIIQKRYEVADIGGLITFLKECGVNPKIFKSFLTVHKTVNVKELERLEELGMITTEQIKGCYTVKSQNPYFTVNIEKGQEDG